MKHFLPGGIRTAFCWFLGATLSSAFYVPFLLISVTFPAVSASMVADGDAQSPLFRGSTPELGVKPWVWVCEVTFCPCGLPESCSLPGGGRGRGQGGVASAPVTAAGNLQDFGTSELCSRFSTQKVSSGSQMSWRAHKVPFIEYIYENQVFVRPEMDQSQEAGARTTLSSIC